MTEILITIQGIAVSTAFLTIILAVILKATTKSKDYKNLSSAKSLNK